MKKTPDIHVNFRLRPEVSARVDEARRVMSERSLGLNVDKSRIYVMAIERGLPSIEAELGIK